jgi:hypothetical protein
VERHARREPVTNLKLAHALGLTGAYPKLRKSRRRMASHEGCCHRERLHRPVPREGGSRTSLLPHSKDAPQPSSWRRCLERREASGTHISGEFRSEFFNPRNDAYRPHRDNSSRQRYRQNAFTRRNWPGARHSASEPKALAAESREQNDTRPIDHAAAKRAQLGHRVLLSARVGFDKPQSFRQERSHAHSHAPAV